MGTRGESLRSPGRNSRNFEGRIEFRGQSVSVEWRGAPEVHRSLQTPGVEARRDSEPGVGIERTICYKPRRGGVLGVYMLCKDLSPGKTSPLRGSHFDTHILIPQAPSPCGSLRLGLETIGTPPVPPTFYSILPQASASSVGVKIRFCSKVCGRRQDACFPICAYPLCSLNSILCTLIEMLTFFVKFRMFVTCKYLLSLQRLELL